MDEESFDEKDYREKPHAEMEAMEALFCGAFLILLAACFVCGCLTFIFT